MVFVFEVDTAVLHGHADVAAALAGCDAAGLKAQRWLFFDASGQPLRAECLAGEQMFLRPWASCSSCSLEQLLPWVRELAGGLSVDRLRQLYPESTSLLDAAQISCFGLSK